MTVISIFFAIILIIIRKRKKDDHVICETKTDILDNELPYKRGLPEIQNECEHALFDQFVRERWSKNYERYELIGSSLSANFLAPHRIIVHHTDGTFHDEVIRVSASYKANEGGEYGKVYKFTVWGEDDRSNTSQKKEEPIAKPESHEL